MAPTRRDPLKLVAGIAAHFAARPMFTAAAEPDDEPAQLIGVFIDFRHAETYADTELYQVWLDPNGALLFAPADQGVS